jgi:hypothetical protein
MTVQIQVGSVFCGMKVLVISGFVGGQNRFFAIFGGIREMDFIFLYGGAVGRIRGLSRERVAATLVNNWEPHHRFDVRNHCGLKSLKYRH